MDFDGYFNLMNHRKIVHPSNKKCRNFPSNCSFGSECWYVHIEQEKDTEEFSDNFKCDTCEEEIRGRNNFMKHKKMLHSETIPTCNLFKLGKCSRSEETCWFEHKRDASSSKVKEQSTGEPKSSTQRNKKQVFQEALGENHPPDQLKTVLDMVTMLCTKMEDMEMKIQTMMK